MPKKFPPEFKPDVVTVAPRLRAPPYCYPSTDSRFRETDSFLTQRQWHWHWHCSIDFFGERFIMAEERKGRLIERPALVATDESIPVSWVRRAGLPTHTGRASILDLTRQVVRCRTLEAETREEKPLVQSAEEPIIEICSPHALGGRGCRSRRGTSRCEQRVGGAIEVRAHNRDQCCVPGHDHMLGDDLYGTHHRHSLRRRIYIGHSAPAVHIVQSPRQRGDDL